MAQFQMEQNLSSNLAMSRQTIKINQLIFQSCDCNEQENPAPYCNFRPAKIGVTSFTRAAQDFFIPRMPKIMHGTVVLKTH